MPDSTGKLNSPIQTLHLDTAPVLHVDPVLHGDPVLHVDPVLQHGGPAADPVTAMQSAMTALQAQNATLQARVAELEKNMVAVRLILQGLDPALSAVGKRVDDLRAEYAAHGHELPLSYQPFSTMKDDPDRDFMIAYIWEGQHQTWAPYQQQQDAQKRGASTGKPQPAS